MSHLWQWLFETSDQSILLCFIIVFCAGLLSGWWIRRAGEKKKTGPVKSIGDEAFFKGFQHILSNDQDHAIEEFTKSVQVNSDTIETYVALGNLYRSKGDIDRAVRIRQSIILRPNINENIKLRSLFDLGLDYRKGGFLNRALKTFLEVARKEPSNIENLKEIERIYEELKDWENAYSIRQRISKLKKGDHAHILAHYLVEAGKVYYDNGDLNRAKSFFSKAISTHKGCVDAYLHLGDLYFAKDDYKKAVSIWKKIVRVAPQFIFLAYRRFEGAYSRMKNLKPVEDFLKECAQTNRDAFTYLALARFIYNKDDIEGALREITNALDLDPLFWEARKFRGEILIAEGREKEILRDYGDIIKHLKMAFLRFQCTKCGFQPNDLEWQCLQCKSWDTIRQVNSTEARPTAVPQEKDSFKKLSQGN